MLKRLVWHIDEALFQFCDEAEKARWESAGMPISFEFDPESSDDGGKSIMPNAKSQYFDICKNKSKVIVQNRGNIYVAIKAWVFFWVDIKENIIDEEIEAWSSEKGGWECATISTSAYESHIISDSGGDIRP